MWYVRVDKMYASETIPATYPDVITPTTTGSFVKFFEILMQDICAFLIVGSLLTALQSFALTVFVFTVIVFLFHLPSIKLFGFVYGSYFLGMSTLLAFCVPLLYWYGLLGLLFVLTLHVSMYAVMYIGAYYLGSKKV